MTNALVNTFGTADFEAIAAATGAFVGASTYLPNLNINRDTITLKKQVIAEPGEYMISQDGVKIYSKTALFRVFLSAYQYMTWDNSAKKFSNKSMIVKSLREEALDELGGLKCGAVSSKEKQALKAKGLLTPAQENTSCHRKLYGLVTFEDAVTETGEKTSVENLPVIWDNAKSNFNAATEALDAITKMRHVYFQHWLFLGEPEMLKSGATTYFVAHAKPILDKDVEFTPEDVATFKMFQETIDRENSYVAEKWRQAKRHSEPFDLGSRNALADLELNDPIDDI